MIGAVTLEGLLHDFAKRAHSSLALGLLFARPESSITSEYILPNLNYFNLASGRKAHFWLAGYGAYWPIEDRAYLDAVPVTTVDSVQWLYSTNGFDRLRRAIEERSNWRYSGAVDLLLFGTTVDNDGRIAPLFETAYCLQLKGLLQNGSIRSIEELFQSVFSFAEHYEGDDFLAAWYASPELEYVTGVPQPVLHLWQRASLQLTHQDYPGVLHSCASIFETMAKHIVDRPTVKHQSLGSFFPLYRRHSRLEPKELDKVLSVYNERGSTPLAGHGSLEVPGVSRDRALGLMRFTSRCVRTEYRSNVLFVGRTEQNAAAA